MSGDLVVQVFAGFFLPCAFALVVDLVAMVPLFPSKVVEFQQHSFDPLAAGLPDPFLGVVLINVGLVSTAWMLGLQTCLAIQFCFGLVERLGWGGRT